MACVFCVCEYTVGRPLSFEAMHPNFLTLKFMNLLYSKKKLRHIIKKSLAVKYFGEFGEWLLILHSFFLPIVSDDYMRH